MKTIYLALVAFFTFSSHLVYKPNLFTALCVGFSVAFVCFCEYINYKSSERLSETEKENFKQDYNRLQDQLEGLKSEMASLKLGAGFRRQR
jgi:hypothetical protein